MIYHNSRKSDALKNVSDFFSYLEGIFSFQKEFTDANYQKALKFLITIDKID